MSTSCGLCQCEVEGSWEEHVESQQHQDNLTDPGKTGGAKVRHKMKFEEAMKGETREVKPARLPRFPRFAVCPRCGKGGVSDTTVCSYVDSGMPEDSPRYIGCGYCGYDGPAPDHPLYPREGKQN